MIPDPNSHYDCDHCEGHSSLGCDMRCERFPPQPSTPINLFTDIFSKDIGELTEGHAEQTLAYLEAILFDDSGVDYDEEERKDNLFKVILYKLGWGDMRKRKWILFIPIYGTFIYIMSLILDTDIIGFFKHIMDVILSWHGA